MMFYNTVFCRREILAFMCPADVFGTSMEILQKATKNTDYGFFCSFAFEERNCQVVAVGLFFWMRRRSEDSNSICL